VFHAKVIYAIKHLPTEKIYIGATENVHRRMQAHFGALRRGQHPNREMQADCDCCGGRYVVYLLDVIQTRADKNKEFYWMDALKTRDPKYGYNTHDPSTPDKEVPPKSLLGAVLQEVDLRKKHLAEKFP